jgi:hypothetical protein
MINEVYYKLHVPSHIAFAANEAFPSWTARVGRVSLVVMRLVVIRMRGGRPERFPPEVEPTRCPGARGVRRSADIVNSS